MFPACQLTHAYQIRPVDTNKMQYFQYERAAMAENHLSIDRIYLVFMHIGDQHFYT